MSGLTANLNPNVVKTALDDVFVSEYENVMNRPEFASVMDEEIFKQKNSDKAAEIMETFEGVGTWEERQEEQNVKQQKVQVDNQKTYSMKEFAKEIPISVTFFEDDQHDVVGDMVRSFAHKARVTKEKVGMELYRDAFTGSTYTTDDGKAIVADDHTNIAGNTVDNKLTAALSPKSLNDAQVKLVEQEDQSGEVVPDLGNCLLVPPALFKEALEITDSELEAGTADNQMNVFRSSTYGFTVKQSPYLGAALGGSDTAWFLLSRFHSVMRFDRIGVETDLVDYIYSDNNMYRYKGRYRETYGAQTYQGLVGSDGTT